MFQHLFDIEFNYNNHARVRGILPFKFAWCFGSLEEKIKLSAVVCRLSVSVSSVCTEFLTNEMDDDNNENDKDDNNKNVDNSYDEIDDDNNKNDEDDNNENIDDSYVNCRPVSVRR